MSVALPHEHPFPETIGNAFIEDARLVYSDEGAWAIGQTIISSVAAAIQSVPLPAAHDIKLRLAVMRPPGDHDRNHPVHLWADYAEPAIAIMCNPDANYQDIVDDLPSGLVHEFAHLAHYQHNPHFTVAARFTGQNIFFAAIVREGIADQAVFEQCDDLQQADHEWQFRNDSTLTTELAQLVNHPGRGQDEREYNFLYGREIGFPRPYFLGHYVVSSLSTHEGYSIQDLMQLPLDDYIKFATSELL